MDKIGFYFSLIFISGLVIFSVSLFLYSKYKKNKDYKEWCDQI